MGAFLDHRYQSIIGLPFGNQDSIGRRGQKFSSILPGLNGVWTMARNLLVVQGGGPTQVLNATLAAIVREAQADRRLAGIWGARWGMHGLVQGDVVDLSSLSSADLDLLCRTPGSVLGSSRFRPNAEDLERVLGFLKQRGVADILFIGGNGTMRGAEVVSRYCRESGYEVRIIGVPKTVDNDLAGTDRCPGYASAALYASQSARDLGNDVRGLPQPISILETMGRSVGWLAAAAAAGKRDEQDAPHLVYVPEKAFAMDRFLGDLDNIVTRQGWAIVVVAEGIQDANGRLVYQTVDPAQADPLQRPLTGGVAQFLAENVARSLKKRCRSEKPGLLGRSSTRHLAARDLLDAEATGRGAVRSLLADETEKMVSLLPLRDAASASECALVPMRDVAGVERPIPAAWISDGAIPVTDKFFEYLNPLVGELAPCYGPLSEERSVVGKF